MTLIDHTIRENVYDMVYATTYRQLTRGVMKFYAEQISESF